MEDSSSVRCWPSTRYVCSAVASSCLRLVTDMIQHMNLVLADTEEFRRVKRKSKASGAPGAAGSSAQQTVESEEKRALGLAIVRGSNVVSCSLDGPPPADPSARLGTSAPGATAPAAMAAGPGISRPAGRGAGIGLQGPAAGVGGPGFPGRGGPPPGFPPGFPPGGFAPPPGFAPPGGAPPGFAPPPGGRGFPPR